MKQNQYVSGFIKPILLKRLVICTMLLIGTTHSLRAQSISPATLNSGGISANSASFINEWSFGENTAINTMQGSNLTVTNGVLQDYTLFPTSVKQVSSQEFGPIQVYPIPAVDILEIKMPDNASGVYKIEVFDMKGIRMLQKQVEFSEHSPTAKLTLSEFAVGNYLLFISPDETKSTVTYPIQTFKIVKIY